MKWARFNHDVELGGIESAEGKPKEKISASRAAAAGRQKRDLRRIAKECRGSACPDGYRHLLLDVVGQLLDFFGFAKGIEG